jgi:hypothetical protein
MMTIDELYSENGVPFRLKYIQYLKDNFGDVLGSDVLLLDQPGGLEIVRDKYQAKMRALRENRDRDINAA